MKAVIAALLANLGIAIVKFVAFLITGSASMLAESVHSVADTGNEVLLLVGRGRSDRPRTSEHPFGFGRERYFYSFVVAVMLFTVGAAFSVYDGIHKMLDPEPVHDAGIALGVLAVAAVLESLSLRTGVHEANAVRGGRAWPTFIRRAKAPELPVVLLEDMAALIGLGFAFTGVSLAWGTGDGIWDGAGSLAIGLLLACAAAILAVETKSLLIGESAGAEVERQVVAAIEDGPEVEQVIHLRTVHVGPDSLLVAAKIAVRPTDTAAQIAAAINVVEARIRAAVPIAQTIYLEPDIYHESLIDDEDPSSQAAQTTRPTPTRISRPDPSPLTRPRSRPPAGPLHAGPAPCRPAPTEPSCHNRHIRNVRPALAEVAVVRHAALSPLSGPFHHFPWYIPGQMPQLLTSTGARAS
jgi:cation diffusion facilitator family transporter